MASHLISVRVVRRSGARPDQPSIRGPGSALTVAWRDYLSDAGRRQCQERDIWCRLAGYRLERAGTGASVITIIRSGSIEPRQAASALVMASRGSGRAYLNGAGRSTVARRASSGSAMDERGRTRYSDIRWGPDLRVVTVSEAYGTRKSEIVQRPGRRQGPVPLGHPAGRLGGPVDGPTRVPCYRACVEATLTEPLRGALGAQPALHARWLGRIGYRDAHSLQKRLVDQRAADQIPDLLLLLEHPAVLTLGKNSDPAHILASPRELEARGIAVEHIERGGEVTYHGPGQLVGYPIVRLHERGLLLRPFVRALETAMVETCASLGVAAARRDGHPGCWCDPEVAEPRKIGALGLRIERGVSYHGIALNAAGIATFEIDMWAPRGLRGGPSGRPRRISETLPDAYGALLYLKDHPAIDPEKIGIMGFSWGGALSLLTTSAWLTEQWTAGRARYVAHVPFYPVCYSFLSRYRTDVDQMTGAPVLILAGAKDDYEEPDTCPKFVASLTPEQRAHVSLIVYPDGYHGWDASRAATFHDPAANKGQGGNIRFYPDSRIAEQSRKEAVEFFRKAFGM